MYLQRALPWMSWLEVSENYRSRKVIFQKTNGRKIRVVFFLEDQWLSLDGWIGSSIEMSDGSEVIVLSCN